MQLLIRRAGPGTAALSAAALLVSCSATAPPAESSSSPSAAGPPAAWFEAGAAARQELPLVAGQWPTGDREVPRNLTWQPPAGTADRQPLKITVRTDSVPAYVSFMLHQRVNSSGIPDEDYRRQTVLACGVGITDPGCRITAGPPGHYTVETARPVPEAHPYRVLYAQWAPAAPDSEETWASWQLPTG